MAKRSNPDDRDKKFGQELARLRKAAGLTQPQLAKLLGISHRQLGEYERGRVGMKLVFFEAAPGVLLQRGSVDGFGEAATAYVGAGYC